MDRRRFLNGCALTGLLLASGLPSCSEPKSRLEWDFQKVSKALQSGVVSPLDLVQEFQQRNSKLNPLLSCTVETHPNLEGEAKRIEITGPLSGWPILIKGNIATGDGMANSGGSLALADWRPREASKVVERLRKAGLLIAGKANMSEWANFRSTNSSSGWSARGGQCRNPHALNRSACGSSSGSAAAVAAGIVGLALGTETMGSIICPSSICGIVGLKPTKDLVPTDGVIPGAHFTDCVGPMARSVEATAHLLNALTDSKIYHQALSKEALKGKRIGVGRQNFGFDRRVDALMEEQILQLSKLGAKIVDPVEYSGWGVLGADFLTVSSHELKAGLDEYLSSLPPEIKVRSLQDVITFNLEHPEQEAMSYLGQQTFEAAVRTQGLQSEAYLQALKRLKAHCNLEQVLAEKSLDAILAPSNGPAWTIDFVNGDHFEGGSAASPAIAGVPHITVPCGAVHKLPIGLSLFGPKHSEPVLLAMAYAFEQATQARLDPGFTKFI